MSDNTPKGFYDSPTDKRGLRVAFEKVFYLFFPISFPPLNIVTNLTNIILHVF